jgi:hypothetical protein
MILFSNRQMQPPMWSCCLGFHRVDGSVVDPQPPAVPATASTRLAGGSTCCCLAFVAPCSIAGTVERMLFVGYFIQANLAAYVVKLFRFLCFRV